MVKTYVKQNIAIQAVQWTGNNRAEIFEFIGDACLISKTMDNPEVIIHTLEGDHYVSVGDYIICGVKGEFYPCKPDIFEMTYKEVAISNERDSMDVILNSIGAPAALEQCAEECSELAQACLKLARKIRGENPTPCSEESLYAALEEEISDVELCIDVLLRWLFLIDEDSDNTNIIKRLDDNRFEKLDRWKYRLGESNNEN